MDFSPSRASCLPRIWVIEALACSNQVDASLLLELLQSTPEITEDFGRNARELVSLRILESILAKTQNVNSLPSNEIPKILLDPSELCEDVLRRILTEICASNIDRSEILKWDVEPFVEHKRSTLAKYALQQLNDAIRSGKHSSLASFREQSGLPAGTPFEHGARIDVDEYSDGRPQKSGTDGINVLGRKRSATEANAVENSCSDLISFRNVKETNVESIKKHKHNILDHDRDVVGELKSSCIDVQLAAASKILMQYNERQSSRLVVGKPHDLGVTGPFVPDNEDTSSRGFVGIDELQPHADLVHCADGEANRKCAEEHDQHRDMDQVKVDRDGFCNINITDKDECISKIGVQINANVGEKENVNISSDSYEKNNEENNIASEIRTSDVGTCRRGSSERDHTSTGKQNLHHDTDMPNKNFHVDHGQEHRVDDAQSIKVLHELAESKEGDKAGVSSDSADDEEDEADVVKKKIRYLSSQIMYSQDSVTPTDLRDLNLCVKCNTVGKLLVCSSESCSLVIHDSCLGSDARFDRKEKFYCPFCAYSRAISKCAKVKKKASLARKDLSAFISEGRVEKSKNHCRSYSAKENSLEKNDDSLPKCDEPNISNDLERTTGSQGKKNPLFEQGEPSLIRSDDSHLGEKASGSISEVPDTLKNGNQEGKEVRLMSEPARVLRQHQTDAPASCKSRGVNASSSCQLLEEFGEMEKETRIRSKKEVVSTPEKDLAHGSKSSPPIQSKEDKGKLEVSKKPIRVSKQKEQYTNLPLPAPRRQLIPWTTEEEDLLKEGVKRFYTSGTTIPWTKILEFGADVFQGRRTLDLKNKWRSIAKAASK